MKKCSLSLKKFFELDLCPCEVCSSQDDEDTLLDRQKLDEACDVISNQMIDLIIENPKKYLLKHKDKQDNVE